MQGLKSNHVSKSHNEFNGVSRHQRLDCLFNRLSRRRSKKTSKLRVTGLCEGNPPVTDGFPSQRGSNAEMFPFDDVILGARLSAGTMPKFNNFLWMLMIPYNLCWPDDFGTQAHLERKFITKAQYIYPFDQMAWLHPQHSVHITLLWYSRYIVQFKVGTMMKG